MWLLTGLYYEPLLIMSMLTKVAASKDVVADGAGFLLPSVTSLTANLCCGC